MIPTTRNREDRIKILLIAPRPENLSALEAVLMRPQYEVRKPNSSEEALAALRRDDFALIVLAVGMPRTDGFEMATLIRKRRRSQRVPILFITAPVSRGRHRPRFPRPEVRHDAGPGSRTARYESMGADRR